MWWIGGLLLTPYFLVTTLELTLAPEPRSRALAQALGVGLEEVGGLESGFGLGVRD